MLAEWESERECESLYRVGACKMVCCRVGSNTSKRARVWSKEETDRKTFSLSALCPNVTINTFPLVLLCFNLASKGDGKKEKEREIFSGSTSLAFYLLAYYVSFMVFSYVLESVFCWIRIRGNVRGRKRAERRWSGHLNHQVMPKPTKFSHCTECLRAKFSPALMRTLNWISNLNPVANFCSRLALTSHEKS